MGGATLRPSPALRLGVKLGLWHRKRGNKARMSMKTKDRSRNQLPLFPPYPRRGIPGSPPQIRRGWGWCDFAALACFAPWRETGCLMSKMREQSENVYENKGAAGES